jgi:trimethylamine--corrinoid protein Co-methyltransferase
MICGAGLLNGATLFSYEQLLMDCEIYDVIRRVVEGVNVDEESLALEVIERVVNTEKHFMTDPHTIRHGQYGKALHDGSAHHTSYQGNMAADRHRQEFR